METHFSRASAAPSPWAAWLMTVKEPSRKTVVCASGPKENAYRDPKRLVYTILIHVLRLWKMRRADRDANYSYTLDGSGARDRLGDMCPPLFWGVFFFVNRLFEINYYYYYYYYFLIFPVFDAYVFRSFTLLRYNSTCYNVVRREAFVHYRLDARERLGFVARCRVQETLDSWSTVHDLVAAS
jgi:hypothetical protein